MNPQTQVATLWARQRHKECGGEIVLVVKTDHSDIGFCCKKCGQVWRAKDISAYPADQWEMFLAGTSSPDESRVFFPGRDTRSWKR